MTDQEIKLYPGDTLSVIVAGGLPVEAGAAPAPETPALEVTAAAPSTPGTEEEIAAAAQGQARTDQAAAAKKAHEAGADGTYTVQPGDTLASIAEAIYGSADLAGELYAANTGAIGGDAAIALAPGTVLAVPAPPPAQQESGNAQA